MHLSNLCVFHYHSDAFSCDETQKKAGETLPNGQYLLTNGSVSFKVSKMEKTSLANFTKAKHSFLTDNF